MEELKIRKHPLSIMPFSQLLVSLYKIFDDTDCKTLIKGKCCLTLILTESAMKHDVVSDVIFLADGYRKSHFSFLFKLYAFSVKKF